MFMRCKGSAAENQTMQHLRGRACLLACAAAWSAGLGLCVVAQAQTLTLHYQERAPYSVARTDGSVGGVVATPAALALSQAALPFVWARTPSQRQLALIQEGEGLHCGVGWFRNPERAALGKFSKPLYRDKPFGALVRNDSPLRSGMRGAEALALAADTLLVKDGYSYGPQFDRLIAAHAPPPLKTSAETQQMLRMLLAGRAGWIIVTPEESQVLRDEAGTAGAGLRQVVFADISAGETRHLYCNSSVPDAWLARIDQALAAQARNPAP
jgi:polar amino acid transport system substrate-binding protein